MPNNKLQINIKFKIQRGELNFEIYSLEFIWNLGFVFWNFWLFLIKRNFVFKVFFN